MHHDLSVPPVGFRKKTAEARAPDLKDGSKIDWELGELFLGGVNVLAMMVRAQDCPHLRVLKVLGNMNCLAVIFFFEPSQKFP